ncbi:TPA: DUF551 domain-containing protein [Citrobacter koseri]|nr:DUF551 domain-containing protein [Citrobacter koseri]
MKTIQLSERELSIIFSMLTPPYPVRDTHTDEFNELRNKVFYALRDAQNDEPVSDAYKLPVIGWLRSDYNSDDKRDPNAPLFMLGSNDPSETWGVKYLPLSGNSPVIPDRWIPVSERVPESNGVYFGWDGKRVLEVNCFFGGFSANQFIHGEITHWMPLPAAPQQEVKQALAKGMERYGDSMQELAKKEVK